MEEVEVIVIDEYLLVCDFSIEEESCGGDDVRLWLRCDVMPPRGYFRGQLYALLHPFNVSISSTFSFSRNILNSN